MLTMGVIKQLTCLLAKDRSYVISTAVISTAVLIVRACENTVNEQTNIANSTYKCYQ